MPKDCTQLFTCLLCFQVTQVGEVLRALGQNPTEGDVKKLVQSTNSKGGPDARITFETFLPLLQVLPHFGQNYLWNH